MTKTVDKYQIRTFKEDGSDERKLPEESEEIYSARWSPKGDSFCGRYPAPRFDQVLINSVLVNLEFQVSEYATSG